MKFDPSWDDQDQQKNHNELLEGERVLWRNAQWRVTSVCLEAKADPAEMGPPYYVTKESVGFDIHLRDHVCSKNWVNRDLFLEAYDKARELYSFGISWNSKYEGLDALARKLGLPEGTA